MFPQVTPKELLQSPPPEFLPALEYLAILQLVRELNIPISADEMALVKTKAEQRIREFLRMLARSEHGRD